MQLSKRATTSVSDLLTVVASQDDPVSFLLDYLKKQRVPPQGRFFYSQVITGIAIHAGLIACVVSCTVARWKYGHLWFVRRHQGRIRLNATVIALLLAAVYSSMAIAYSALLVHQQELGRYVAGSAAFELSCFGVVSACVSIICYSWYEALPAGLIEWSLFRSITGRKHAATDGRIFDFGLLCLWLVLSIAGSMVAPIIHDYWRREADSTVASLIARLSRPEARQQGLMGLLALKSQAELLFQQLEKSVDAVRYQCLVYLGHAAVYLLLLLPVAGKLISLLNNQIYGLHRAADDFFRMGSRLEAAKNKNDLQQPVGPTQSQNRLARKPVPASDATAHNVQCTNCKHEMAVAVHFDGAQQDSEKEKLAELPRPIIAPLAIPPIPDTQLKRLQPRFARPNLPLHAEFPLVRAKKLSKVRLELFVFATILIAAMCAFTVATSILYYHIPKWSAGEVTVACYTVFLWNFAIPAGLACGLFVYMTLSLPRTGSSVASTPTSKSSAPTTGRMDVGKLVNKLASVGKIEKHEMLPVSTSAGHPNQQAPVMATKRTQPTFPRAASVASLGMTTEAGKTERTDFDTDSESGFVPPVPAMPLSRSASRVKKWVNEDSRTAESLATPMPAPPPPASVASLSPTRLAKKKRSMGPVSQTQSWLDVDEE